MTNNENCGDRPIYFKNLSGHETGKFYSMARRTDKRVEKYEKMPCVGSYDLARVRTLFFSDIVKPVFNFNLYEAIRMILFSNFQ